MDLDRLLESLETLAARDPLFGLILLIVVDYPVLDLENDLFADFMSLLLSGLPCNTVESFILSLGIPPLPRLFLRFL